MIVTRIPFRKKLALRIFVKYRANERKIHQLKYLFWECTLRCNLNCRHCGSDCVKDSATTDMPVADFLQAIDQIKDKVNPHTTMVVFTGGEALLRKDLEDAGLQLYEREFPWGLVTNGMLLTEKRLASLIAAGMRAITISLDGLEKSHDWLRNSTSGFTRVLQAIRLVVKIPELKFDVVTCVHQKNLRELEDIKELLIKEKVREWRIFTIFPKGRAFENSQLQLSPQEFKSVLDFIKMVRKENKIRLNYGCEGFLGTYEKEVRDQFFFCQAGINVASVLADGSISACPSLRQNFIQGNIYKDHFAEVWENRFKAYRNRNWTHTGICSDCNLYSFCEGNGMHLRDEKTGELLLCHLKRLEA